jgi:2-dehydro-3-deoxyphosphogluconate aldolase / (4S)-4-hydroxy-2-oxoglutarate aldolase
MAGGVSVETLEAVIAPPVVPVLTIEDPDHAVPLARALVAGGLTTIEVTLRTATAIEAIGAIATEVPDALVGAGTVIQAHQIDAALQAGARFLVSPGCTPALLDALQETEAPFVPGAATPSEIIQLLERGVTVAKLFPAYALGGIRLLSALSGPFPEFRFCPTGGIDLRLACDYLALPNVSCVGGSWMAPGEAVSSGNWEAIEGLARTAAALAPIAVASGSLSPSR